MRRPTPRQVLLAQGTYYVATGVAPFISRRLFETVTGPKCEWWLVKTTGVLVTTVGAGTLSAVLRGRQTPEIVGMAACCAGGWQPSTSSTPYADASRPSTSPMPCFRSRHLRVPRRCAVPRPARAGPYHELGGRRAAMDVPER